jgi:D-alanyl-D-alanine carboxypeptidase
VSLPIAVLSAGVGLAAAAPSAPAAEPTTLKAALEQLVTMPGGPPGAAVIVHRGHHPRFHSAGVARVGTADRWQRSDHMRLASISKAFNGATALALVRRHRLSLGDTVGDLLPFAPKAWRSVTVAEALQHTSGLPDFSMDRRFLNLIGRRPHKRFHPRQLIGFVAHKKLNFRPGTRYEYSNTDNIVVGLMIEAASGHSYVHELRRFVIRPLGLGETSLPVGARIHHPFVRGYAFGGPGPPTNVSHVLGMSGAWASGGMVTSPRDLDRFIRAYVSGRLFGHRLHRRQLRFRPGAGDPPGPGRNSVGLAIFRWRTPCGTVFGHTGNFPGYTQFAAASRNGHRSVTFSINTALSPPATGSQAAFAALRHAEQLAICAALR